MTKPLKPYIHQEGEVLCGKCLGAIKRPLNHTGQHSKSLGQLPSRVENTCKQCGNVFITVKSMMRKYCSLECAYASKDRIIGNPQNNLKPRKIKVCTTCKKEFPQPPGRNKQEFCSVKCLPKQLADPDNKLSLVCPVCKKPFEAWKNKPAKHCSRKCARKDPDTLKKIVETRTENGSYSAKFNYSRALRGERRGQYFRSRMEANYAAYLDNLNIKWEYEPKIFWFPVKRGCVSYTPDFYLPDQDKYIETKGWMDARSKTKINRMRIYHPKVVLEVVDWKAYQEIGKKAAEIPNWEFNGKRAV